MKKIINDREITIVQYVTDYNWYAKIPNSNWLCILVDNDKKRRYVDEVIAKIINKDVCYVCTVGESCERTHDLFDEEIVFREVEIDEYYLPKHHIITTWHNGFNEGIKFGICNAYHDEIEIKEVVILDMTDGAERARIDKELAELADENE